MRMVELRCSSMQLLKRRVDPFTKKDWYDVKAPSMFNVRTFGKTPVTRSSGTRVAANYLKGRIFNVSLGDLNQDEDQAYRKMKLQVQDVQGRHCLTNFYGMDLTTDKARSLVKKWQTLIEAHTDVRTSDGFTLRLFVVAFTKKRPNQVSRACHAQTAQVKRIRARMLDVVKKQTQGCDLKQLVKKFIPEVIGKEVEKACSPIFPVKDCYVRKAKMVKAPKFDPTKLQEVHDDYSNEQVGQPVGAGRKDETPAAPSEPEGA